MADIGYVESELGALPTDQKRSLVSAFRYVLSNLTLGAPEHQKRATNFQLYYLSSTTASDANAEFSIGKPGLLVVLFGRREVIFKALGR